MLTRTVHDAAIMNMWSGSFTITFIPFMVSYFMTMLTILERRKEESEKIYRSLYLHSETLGLVVRCDLVEEKGDKIYPVEYKRGRYAHWENNHLQLCAQALALEEALNRKIEYGYLFFYGSFRRKKVTFDESLRKKTVETIDAIRGLYERECPPDGIEDWSRCKKCSMVDYCLPLERKSLRGKVAWEHFI